MSLAQTLKKLFPGRRRVDAVLDEPLSVAAPPATVTVAEPPTEQAAPADATAIMAAPSASPSGAAATDAQPTTLQPEPAAEASPDGAQTIDVPLLGRRAASTHQRLLGTVLVASLLALLGMAVMVVTQSGASSQQLAASGQALAQLQRVVQTSGQALAGRDAAFSELAEASGRLSALAQALDQGDASGMPGVGGEARNAVVAAQPALTQVQQQSQALLALRKALSALPQAAAKVQAQTSGLAQALDSIETIKLGQNAALPDIAAVYQLKVLLVRLHKASEDALGSSTPPQAAALDKDLAAFAELVRALQSGNSELRIAAPRDGGLQERVDALAAQAETVRQEAGAIVQALEPLAQARKAQASLVAQAEPARRQLETLQLGLSELSGISGLQTSLMLLMVALAVFSAAGLAYVQLQRSRLQHQQTELQRQQAERLEQEAKRVNDANQAAILRLMNELQNVAEGDLTQEATVTEDITGAIADSVNYTVEELRTLVASVQTTASKVAQTTAEVDANSTELLAASQEQLHEIRETGQAMLEMAGRINAMSAQAQESASVAMQSLEAAETGLKAVQNTIDGMNTIRDQIQDTSKRIKRLGESSQEIGEITELISDITEQTNVLALNAAIQAASAGEAGRGFSVVAEEVQRLAERSADATRQIAALVKAIQTDTQDAIGAMERSTQGVVQGAQLSDNAGTALSEIDRVTRRVAELIDRITKSSLHEASLANDVAQNIQHIFAVTEQTSDGTRVTASQVRELSRMAEELRQSVARFKIQ